MKKRFVLSLTVEDGNGMRLDRWLKKKYPTLTQGIIEKLLRLGKIRLDGQKVAASARVTVGQIVDVPDTIEITTQMPSALKQKPAPTFTQEDEQFLESIILWEDDDILVLNKPAGLATQGGTNTTRHMDGLLEAYGTKKGVRYRLVHRLDRDTSGVFLIAKNIDSATFLGEAFRSQKVQKIYWAIALGQPKPGQGTIDAPLLKGGDGNYEKVAVHKEGKSAITHYRTIKGLSRRGIAEFSWLELSPETGRTHQLRVHLAHIGNPILGDGKYGGKEATALSRDLHLHSRVISFPDRQTGSTLTFAAPPPPHFEATLKQFNVDWSKMA